MVTEEQPIGRSVEEPVDIRDGGQQASRSRRRRRDDGSTFIEMLVSIVLIGTVGIAVLTALATTTRGAKTHHDLSEAQAWLANAGDAISDSDSFYLSCVDESDPLQTALQYELMIIAPITMATSAPTINVINVEFWDSSIPAYSVADDCNYGPPQGDRLQRVTIQTTVDGDTRTLAVVKRPKSPPTVNTGVPPTTLGGGNIIPPTTPGL